MSETGSDNSRSRGGQTDERARVSRAAGVLAAMTLVSRVAGLARDAAISAVFGTGAGADAFFVAFRIPNLLRRVVAEGATSTAFVPVFTEHLRNEGERGAARAAAAVGGAAVIVLAVLTVIGMVLSGPLTALFAPGFARDPAKQELTVQLTRWTFPYLLLVGSAAWAMGVHHTFRRFALPAAGPVLMNIAIITAVLALAPHLEVPVWSLVAGVLAGGALQVAVQLPSLLFLGIQPEHFAALAHPAVRRCGRLVFAALLGGSVYQVNVLVATVFASLLPAGTVAYLWYADRLFEFPLGIVAVAVGTAALPSLSSQASEADFDAMADTVVHAMSLTVAFCLPAAVGLLLLSHETTALLFERGSFSEFDTSMTAWALRASVPGLVTVGLVRVLSAAFFALERSLVPVATGLMTMLLNVVFSIALMGPVGGGAPWWGSHIVEHASRVLGVVDLRHAGLALATGLSATVNAFVLLLMLRRSLPALRLAPFAKSAAMHAVAALVMAAVVFGWKTSAAALGLDGAGVVSVFGAVTVGSASYLAAALLLGSAEVAELARNAGLARLVPAALRGPR